tara:strand:+ start:1385 stop:1627 length:243 start_codon:yes stop_codon:yes gene_type:complete
MEFSCIKYKWFNSLDNSPFNKLKMNLEEKLKKRNVLTKMVMDLKNQNHYVETKKTIQRLQQEIDDLSIIQTNNSNDPFKQ